MNLVVVESPAKAKTIEKYLGKDFKVLASFGHVRDLPKKKLGVDEDNYDPDYVIPPKAKKTIKKLKDESKKAKELYLATDLDREGEAISWHVVKALGIKEGDKKLKRITFSEITKDAIKDAIKNPRAIDMNLVNAQQARRVIDRLVGYKLSPFLWKKVMRGLSAGRVQSVALRLIVEREREIEKFKPDEYWQIQAILSKLKDDKTFSADLVERDGKKIGKLGIKSEKEAAEVRSDLDSAKYSVEDIERKDSKSTPRAPFTTSTLQMEASRKLRFSAKQTMMLAQKLYEEGHITYMRTDSTNLSGQAKNQIKKIVKDEYGDKYLSKSARSYKKQKRAQEAHEAIRPTNFNQRKAGNDAREEKLYDLIWKRAVASQMADAIFELTNVRIATDTEKAYVFLAKGKVMKFDGFIKVYMEGKDDDEDDAEVGDNIMPELKEEEKLDLHEILADQKFTQPPTRYSEATLVKKMESIGVGRPSTYAPTMSTIQSRGYVTLQERRFHPEEIGMIVNDVLVEHFSRIVDYDFTAKVEDELDGVAAGEHEWKEVVDHIYKPFVKNLEAKKEEVDKKDIIEEVKTDKVCPECGKHMVEKLGRYGRFYACSGFPECKYSEPLEDGSGGQGKVLDENGEAKDLKEAEEEKCEKCGGKMVLKEGRFGKFLACENYPKCKNTKTVVEVTGVDCPECGEGELVERRTRKGKRFWGCSRYPGCKYATWKDPSKQKQEK